MPVFVSSTSSVTRHGVFAIQRTQAPVVRRAGTGVVCMVAQLPWGPDGQLIEEGDGDRGLVIAPPGMSRTGSGYLSTIRKAWPTLLLSRVLGTAAAIGFSQLTAAGPVNIVKVHGKYKGAAINSAVATVSAASDGDSNHFDLSVTVTGASGSTTDTFKNLNYSGVGSDSTPDFSQTRLVGSITKDTSGRPANGTYTFSTGAEGTIDGAAYTGTAGTGDKGIALAESDNRIRHILTDDSGNSLRAAVNAALVTHAETLGDRVAYLNGDSGLSAAATQSDVANYRSTRAIYVDPWTRIYDDTDGTTKRLVPPAAWAASVAAQVSPSTSIAWKHPEVQAMLRGIVELESNRGSAAGANTTAGIVTIIKEETGGWTFEAGDVTNSPVDPTQRTLARTRMGDYIAVSVVRSWRAQTDAPNVPQNQFELVQSLDNFMSALKLAQDGDPNHNPHVLDYAILPPAAYNPQVDLDAGQYVVPLDVKTSSAMERIFLSIRHGETVQIQAA